MSMSLLLKSYKVKSDEYVPPVSGKTIQVQIFTRISQFYVTTSKTFLKKVSEINGVTEKLRSKHFLAYAYSYTLVRYT